MEKDDQHLKIILSNLRPCFKKQTGRWFSGYEYLLGKDEDLGLEPCGGWNMLDPGSGSIRRCGLVGGSVSLQGWAMRPFS